MAKNLNPSRGILSINFFQAGLCPAARCDIIKTMCGISGLAGITDPRQARTAVAAMVCSMARRGPDAEGIESWDNAVLGHRR